MKLNLHGYPCYKDTGLPWASRVPAHWEVRREPLPRNATGKVMKVALETGTDGGMVQE